MVSGMQNNASGIMQLVMDDQPPQELNLWSKDVECETFVDWYLGDNATHTLTLTLVGLDPIVAETPLPGNEAGATAPVMHLTSIVYVFPCRPSDGSF